jgi:hypothetical protein
MTDRKGFFAPEAIPSGWWDETTQPIGWFSDDLLTEAVAPSGPPVIEAADCTNSGNNTSTSSWDLDRPAYSAGDLLIFNLASDNSISHSHNWPSTGPDGETIVTVYDSVGGPNQLASVFYYIATGAQSAGTLTVTPTAAEQWTATVVRIPAGEFNATTPIDSSATNNITTAEADATSPSWTVTAADARVCVWFSIDITVTTATPAGWTTHAEVDRGAIGGTFATRNAGTTASESIAAATWTKGIQTYTGVGYAINAPSSATNYDLTADAGSYVITGTAAGLVAARRLVADPGSYSVTGADATLAKGVRLAADAGAFTVTGTAATLTVARRLTADAASYAVTGADAGLNVGRRLIADGGSYALSGAAADLVVGRRIAADAGSYSVTGADATLTKSRRLDAEAGAYVITGTAAALLWGRRLAADGGSYAVTGAAATLSKSRVFVADPGAFALTGTAATFAILRPTVDSIRVPVWTAGGAVTVPEAQAAGTVDVAGPGSSGAVAVPIQAASETIRVRRI